MEEGAQRDERTLDRVVVDIQMRHQPNARQVTDRHANARGFDMRLEGRQAFYRHVNEDHVGVLADHFQTAEFAQ